MALPLKAGNCVAFGNREKKREVLSRGLEFEVKLIFSTLEAIRQRSEEHFGLTSSHGLENLSDEKLQVCKCPSLLVALLRVTSVTVPLKHYGIPSEHNRNG